MSLPVLNAFLLILPKKVHKLATQYHCMKIIKRTVSFPKPFQTPIVTWDQPVYALAKEIQRRFPEEFSPSSYFTLFGGIHFEQ